MSLRSPVSIAAVSCALMLGCSSDKAGQEVMENPAQAQAGNVSSAGQSGGAGGRAGSPAKGPDNTIRAGAGGQAPRAGSNAAAGAGGKASDTTRAGAGGKAPAGGAGSAAPEADGVSRAEIAPDTAPNISDADYAAFIEHINQFGLDLGQKQAAANKLTQENLIYSPISATYALGMTYGGARGKTAEEMKKVLGDSFAQGIFHKGANKLARELASRAQSRKDSAGVTHKVELNLADALFVDNTFKLQPSFLELMARDYDSGVHRQDFVHAFEPARMEINDWVADQTHDRIENLIPQGGLDANTRLVLVNALYFYGSWLSPFEASRTSDAAFHLLSGSSVQVKTMHDETRLDYAKTTDFELVDLPYEGDKLSMTVVLPAEGKFENVRAQVSAAWLKTATASLAPRTVNIALPKWKIVAGSFSLRQGLEELGMKTAFTDGADLSGLSQDGPLAVSDVWQKAFIAVDELGTEAAAATAVGVGVTSVPVDVVPFVVDRPFLFFIRDQNGAVLFSGQIVDPSKIAP